MNIIRHSLLRFALVGISNTVIGFGAIWIGLRHFHLSDVAANSIGYSLGFLWSFFLNRAWTFNNQGEIGSSILRFAMVCATAYTANLVVVILVGKSLGPGSLLTQACGMVTYTLLCYTGSRIYAFPTPQYLLASDAHPEHRHPD